MRLTEAAEALIQEAPITNSRVQSKLRLIAETYVGLVGRDSTRKLNPENSRAWLAKRHQSCSATTVVNDASLLLRLWRFCASRRAATAPDVAPSDILPPTLDRSRRLPEPRTAGCGKRSSKPRSLADAVERMLRAEAIAIPRNQNQFRFIARELAEHCGKDSLAILSASNARSWLASREGGSALVRRLEAGALLRVWRFCASQGWVAETSLKPKDISPASAYPLKKSTRVTYSEQARATGRRTIAELREAWKAGGKVWCSEQATALVVADKALRQSPWSRWAHNKYNLIARRDRRRVSRGDDVRLTPPADWEEFARRWKKWLSTTDYQFAVKQDPWEGWAQRKLVNLRSRAQGTADG